MKGTATITAWIMFLLLICNAGNSIAQDFRVRESGIRIGFMETGKWNAITDVPGVRVGHKTLMTGDRVRTGVTAILPHPGNIYRYKVPAAIYIANGYGKLTGIGQVKELGNIETPIILTNTLSVPTAADALITYTLKQEENRTAGSVNPVVGETNDGFLNDIRGRHVTHNDFLEAINNATDGKVMEGNIGAGTGTICFGFKGGIGTASRKLPDNQGGYTVGVLVQTNFGGMLQINGVNIIHELEKYNHPAPLSDRVDGSCMIVVATDAPLDARNLERLAKRAMLGLGRTGGISSNGSGDYVIAFSTTEANRIPHRSDQAVIPVEQLLNQYITPLFAAVIEATEEAILNSLFAAETMVGQKGRKITALPVDQVLEILKEKNLMQ
jgi:D-aminopeptidase